MTIGRNRNEFIELDKGDILVESYDRAPRQMPAPDTSLDSKLFEESHLTLSEEQVKIETSRCLKCGMNVVDSNKCLGCGVCTTKCEFDAIHLERDYPHGSDMRTAEDKFKGILPHQLKRVGNMIIHKSDGSTAVVKSDADDHYFVAPEDYPRFK